ncbi:hypothetical protein RB195_016292 [Necator americanus]|uniref:Secreted protein n=1 Tax=Necator americanus TaxID=51031 RepID=A0ABR1E8G7_NECAM
MNFFLVLTFALFLIVTVLSQPSGGGFTSLDRIGCPAPGASNGVAEYEGGPPGAAQPSTDGGEGYRRRMRHHMRAKKLKLKTLKKKVARKAAKKVKKARRKVAKKNKH